MVLFDDVLDYSLQHPTNSVFDDCSDAEEIVDRMVEITRKNFYKTPLRNASDRFYANQRLKFLQDEKPEELQEMFLDESLIDHLIDIQNECERYVEFERIRMEKAWHIQEEIDKDFMHGVGLRNNLMHTIKEDAMRMYVYQ